MNKSIVVGIDGSDSAMNAVRWAAREAVSRGLPLRLVHACMVIDAHAPVALPTSVEDGLARQGSEWLQAAERVATEAEPTVDASVHFGRGSAAELLIEESGSAELVVLGSRGLGGFAGLLVGSVAVALSAHGHCPIVVLHGEQDRTRKPVVVGVDGSPPSEAAIGFAFEVAARLGVPLVAVHAWNDVSFYVKFSVLPYGVDLTQILEEQHKILGKRLAAWQDKYPDVPVELIVTADRPAHSLLDIASDAQLVVVGSRGRGGVAGMLLGSTSQALLHHSPCAVAVVRSTS
nr:universal stress protein [Kibdelosporangium sp. MJ126-NF4]CEL13254.1 Universal stress protein family [Kibdelosporangium sp. MJ126-NF4]CTQ98946.1 Universal stress protein family [Kibdelosporangium sp. MJ126-NF4]